MKLTDYITEWNYIYAERIGLLCGLAEPTPEQKQMASDDADKWCEGLFNR